MPSFSIILIVNKWSVMLLRCTTTFHSDGLVNWMYECDLWIGIRSGRHFISSRGRFSWRIFWQTLQRSRSAGPSFQWDTDNVPHSWKPSKWLGCHQRRVQKNQNPQRQTPADCNDVSTMGIVRWYIHRVECGQQYHPTCKTHLAHSGWQVLVLWLSMTPVLHFTNCTHNHSTLLTYPRQKTNTTVE